MPAQATSAAWSARDRYLNDPRFHQIVHVLKGEIELGNSTPGELGQAVFLAARLSDNYRAMPRAGEHIADLIRRGLDQVESIFTRPPTKEEPHG